MISECCAYYVGEDGELYKCEEVATEYDGEDGYCEQHFGDLEINQFYATN